MRVSELLALLTLLTLLFLPKHLFAEEAKVIFFGHQSVGKNMLQGLKRIVDIKITDISDSSHNAISGDAVIVHKLIGENLHPYRKVDDFKATVAKHYKHIDIAILKLCYVDFSGGFEYEKLFQYYRLAVGEIEQKYPHIKVMHMTVPLKAQKNSFKIAIKKLIGREIWEYQDNIVRNQYNSLIREEYASTGKLFDIAKFESTAKEGGRSLFEYQGKEYESLVPEYTMDGGHLNESGQIYIAEKFLNKIQELK